MENIGRDLLDIFIWRVGPVLALGGFAALALYLWLVWRGLARP